MTETAPHETLKKFGYPATLIQEYEHWVVVLRPKQATLGALVLIAKSDVVAFSGLPAAAFGELERVTQDIESTLQGRFGYDKINYLMLMMVDPQVHFHVLPRYAAVQTYNGGEFADTGWPGPPTLGDVAEIGEDGFAHLLASLRDDWPDREQR